jgi:heme/copper-type cytochrome/quinol oxidase subunit 2
MGSKPRGWMLFLLFSPLVAILVIGILNFNSASAQGQGQNPEQYVIRRIDVWGLFYRLMVAAFVVGSVVQGSIVYVCWRFRESNPKNRVRESLEGAHQ